MKAHGKLIVIKRSGVDGTSIPIQMTTCLFGRSDDCDIRLKLPNVSKEHCRLNIENGKVSLINLSETEQTMLNSKRLSATANLPVMHTDIITISDRKFRWEYFEDSPFFPRKQQGSPRNNSANGMLTTEEITKSPPPGPSSKAGNSPVSSKLAALSFESPQLREPLLRVMTSATPSPSKANATTSRNPVVSSMSENISAALVGSASKKTLASSAAPSTSSQVEKIEIVLDTEDLLIDSIEMLADVFTEKVNCCEIKESYDKSCQTDAPSIIKVDRGIGDGCVFMVDSSVQTDSVEVKDVDVQVCDKKNDNEEIEIVQNKEAEKTAEKGKEENIEKIEGSTAKEMEVKDIQPRVTRMATRRSLARLGLRKNEGQTNGQTFDTSDVFATPLETPGRSLRSRRKVPIKRLLEESISREQLAQLQIEEEKTEGENVVDSSTAPISNQNDKSIKRKLDYETDEIPQPKRLAASTNTQAVPVTTGARDRNLEEEASPSKVASITENLCSIM